MSLTTKEKDENMKKILKWVGIIIIILIVLGAIAGSSDENKNPSVKEAFNEGLNKGKETVEQIGSETENNKSDDSLDLSAERLNLLEDVAQTETMFSDLKEQYQLAKQKGNYEIDSIWIANWNKQRIKLAEPYKDHTFNKNDKYSPAKGGISTALTYLHTLWGEYENSLQGKEQRIGDFEQSVKEGISTAKNNLGEE